LKVDDKDGTFMENYYSKNMNSKIYNDVGEEIKNRNSYNKNAKMKFGSFLKLRPNKTKDEKYDYT
jgi:hypothetical protein